MSLAVDIPLYRTEQGCDKGVKGLPAGKCWVWPGLPQGGFLKTVLEVGWLTSWHSEAFISKAFPYVNNPVKQAEVQMSLGHHEWEICLAQSSASVSPTSRALGDELKGCCFSFLHRDGRDGTTGSVTCRIGAYEVSNQ